jgi:hypothetical protein
MTRRWKKLNLVLWKLKVLEPTPKGGFGKRYSSLTWKRKKDFYILFEFYLIFIFFSSFNILKDEKKSIK